MTAKIVYYGPGLCGKTTNLLIIFDKLDPKARGKMLSLATKTDRTLFFDLLPVDIGKVGPFNLKIQLYTVPGQVFYNETRKLVLKGADAVVFVADSQPSMIESNKESFTNLLENLQENQVDPNEIPIVIQYNKRDIPGVLPVEELQEALGFESYPYAEAAAIKGEGVMETFKLVSKITAKHLINRLQGKPTPKPERDEKKKAAAKKPAATASAKAAPASVPVEEPPMSEPMMNPFADSVPFPDSAPTTQEYDNVEEVSLESLLEGRPATISGNIAVPVSIDEDVEPLAVEAMIEEPPIAVAVEAEPVRKPMPSAKLSKAFSDDAQALHSEIASLKAEVETLREKNQQLIDGVVKSLTDLAKWVHKNS
ncbi:MAG TPA: GTPase domain-containing protein [Thermoanaerobaculia bacterium]